MADKIAYYQSIYGREYQKSHEEYGGMLQRKSDLALVATGEDDTTFHP